MAPNSEPIDFEHLRRELEQRREALQAQVAGLAQRPELGSAQGFGKRIGDGTVEAISRLTEIGVGQSLEAALEGIERALRKLAEGSYGCCDSCGEPIPGARLRARPESALCLACASSAPRPAPRRR